jgi:thiol-disulfide isomerase/thioredoxin
MMMLPAVLLIRLAQTSTTPVPPELTGVLDQHLTASAPSAVVACTGATKADRQLLPDAETHQRRVWSCTMLCSAPIGQRDALLVERRWRPPVLFLDSNNDGTFDQRERHEFPRTGDLHLRIPITSAFFAEYPITIRYRWELYKPHGDPERRMLLESPMVFIGGTVTIAGRPVRVEYPVSPGLWPEMTGGWFRIDANGDGRIDDDPLSEESAPPASKVPILRVGNRYVSTVSVDAITHVVTLREHPPSDYQRIVLRVGEQLPDFKYRDISSGAWSALSDTRSGLVLLVVWSSWCPPALEELPRIEHASRTLGLRGLTVIGLPDDWERRTAEPVISRFRLTWPQADPETIRVMLSENWQVASVPLLVVLDADRRILRISRAGDTSLRGTNLRKTLDRMLRASKR